MEKPTTLIARLVFDYRPLFGGNRTYIFIVGRRKEGKDSVPSMILVLIASAMLIIHLLQIFAYTKHRLLSNKSVEYDVMKPTFCLDPCF